MKQQNAGAFAFLAMGITFLAIGISGQRTFLFVGMAFLAIAAMWVIRGRKQSG